MRHLEPRIMQNVHVERKLIMTLLCETTDQMNNGGGDDHHRYQYILFNSLSG